MSRILAVVVAVGLIVGAVVIRGVIDDDDGEEGSGGSAVVVCAEELRAACEALGVDGYRVTIEDAARTAARITDAEPDFDVWIAPAPWAAMVDDVRTRGGVGAAFDSSVPLASTRLAVLAPASITSCDWRCIGDRAATDLAVGVLPFDSSLGLLTVAAVAGGWFGGASYAANDFDAAFERWLAAFVDAAEPSPNPLNRMLLDRAFFDVAVTLGADATAALEQASPDRKAGLALLYPAPVVNVVAEATPVEGTDVDVEPLTSALRQALVDRGWFRDDDVTTQLPAPGVMTALQDRVR